MERDNECHAKYDYLGDFAQALEQGQARWPKAAIAAQARLGNTDEAANAVQGA